MDTPTCSTCNDERLIANTENGEPWSAWASLPPGSDLAVTTGLVRPIACPACTAVVVTCTHAGCTAPAEWDVFAAYYHDSTAVHPLVSRYPCAMHNACADHVAAVMAGDAASPGSTDRYVVQRRG